VSAADSAGSLRYVFSPPVLWRNLFIALIVGTLLSAANQFDVLLREPMTARTGVKIFFNYVIPFTVSSVSAALNRKK
jgi:uncharacterized membrane protein